MGAKTEISWCDATFNPWAGCTKVSPACDFCYAESDTKRYGYCGWGKDVPRRVTSDSYWRQPLAWDIEAGRTGTRKRVFCGSWCDVMEDRIGLRELRARLYRLIADTANLDWLLTTKRPQNFIRFFPKEWLATMPDNVWCITTVESPEYYWRIQAVAATDAVVRGLSIEPLLSDMPDIGEWLDGINWVIVGGESGPHARPPHPDWVRRIRDAAVERGIAFHFKQWGEWKPLGSADEADNYPFATMREGDNMRWMRLGKKKSGAELDGREWKEFPR